MSTHGRKILVVDDLVDWRETLQGLLSDAGFQVSVAESSDGALQLMKAIDFDLVLVDVRLDESDEDNQEGLALAAVIGKKFPGVKRIIITGYETQDMVDRTFVPALDGTQVAHQFISKTETHKLISMVQKVLANAD